MLLCVCGGGLDRYQPVKHSQLTHLPALFCLSLPTGVQLPTYDAAKLASLITRQKQIMQQSVIAPTRASVMETRAALQREVDALHAAVEMDYVAMGKVVALQTALEEKSAKVPLSEEDYLTLRGRQGALVREMTAMCRELAGAQEYAQLKALIDRLVALQTVDVSMLPFKVT